MKVSECVRLSTVDNFQGEESDVVIISTVRNNQIGKIGFLQIDNRVNVMMSRARHGAYAFGSRATIEHGSRPCVFRSMLSHMKAEGLVGKYLPLRCTRHGTDIQVSTAAEFTSRVPDGGCDKECGARLACGHACARMCHPDDAQHSGARCSQKCLRLHQACEHPCPLMCYQECGKCMTKVQVVSYTALY